MKKIVILGSGAGGTMVANNLRKKLDPKQWQVIIIDNDDHATLAQVSDDLFDKAELQCLLVVHQISLVNSPQATSAPGSVPPGPLRYLPRRLAGMHPW